MILTIRVSFIVTFHLRVMFNLVLTVNDQSNQCKPVALDVNLFFRTRLHFHNAYADPLGWNDNTPFTVHRFCAEELTRLMRTPHSKPMTLVIDSLSWVLRHIKCPTVCRTLHQLRKGDEGP